MENTSILLTIFSLIFSLTSCSKKETKQAEQIPVVSVKTTSVSQGDIENNFSLNGKTIYLKKNTIVSPISGYVQKTYVKFGDKVKKNDLLFEIQTKENRALENSAGSNAGIIKVLASLGGIINELNINETGGYVVEGTAICSIAENKNVIVQVNVPFEYNSLVKTGTKCILSLADNTSFEGTVYQILPVIDEANQTQNVLIKPNTNRQLPENLNLTIQFINAKHSHSLLVSKEAVMTNETQTEFWVMKIINKKMAVKVPIIKGIENNNLIEILSSDLNKNDLLISEGAYGLADSTVVRIVK